MTSDHRTMLVASVARIVRTGGASTGEKIVCKGGGDKGWSDAWEEGGDPRWSGLREEGGKVLSECAKDNDEVEDILLDMDLKSCLDRKVSLCHLRPSIEDDGMLLLRLSRLLLLSGSAYGKDASSK